MSALDAFVGDWLRDALAAKLAVRRPGPAPRGPVEVIYGNEQDAQLQGETEERVVVGLDPRHRMGPITAGAPGRRSLAPEQPGRIAAPFATLRQAFVIFCRVLPPEGTPEAQRVIEGHRRAFSLFRDVAIALDTARDSDGEAAHGSHSLIVDGNLEVVDPEAADYLHGCLLKFRVAVDVPLLGEEAGTILPVLEPDEPGETGVRGVVEACNPSGVCQTVAEIG